MTITQQLTSKQTGFSQDVVKGMSLSDAYRNNYNTMNMKPETINRQAKALMDNSKITARVAELRAPAVEECLLTHKQHLQMLETLRDKAASRGDLGVAVTAEKARGQAAGLYVKKINLNAELKMTGVLKVGGPGLSMEDWLKATGGTEKTE